MAKLYHGVGIDDSGKRNAQYKGSKLVWMNPCFQRWKTMLKRCYGPSGAADSSYYAASVCSDWLNFSAFESWMLDQDYEGLEMDKDFLSLERKIYSPKTCAFVPKEINYFLGSSPSRKGDWPLGVSYSKDREKYSAHLRRFGKSVGLGRFESAEDAHATYQRAKIEVGEQILGSLGESLDTRIVAAMRVIFEKIGDDLNAGRETDSLHPINLPDQYKAKIAALTGQEICL